MTQIEDLRTSNIRQVPSFSSSSRSRENPEVTNHVVSHPEFLILEPEHGYL